MDRSWEDRFDKQFIGTDGEILRIKSFIRSLIEEAKKAKDEEFVGFLKELSNYTKTDCGKDDIREKISAKISKERLRILDMNPKLL